MDTQNICESQKKQLSGGIVLVMNKNSPDVKLPRIIGIECAGEVYDPSNNSFKKVQHVVSLMGGLGRDFDGEQHG